MNRPASLLAALLLFHLPTSAAAPRRQRQQPAQTPPTSARPAPTPTPTPETRPDDDDVVRITTNLVQIDAVVTDRDGRQVTDLRPEDFELSEDGKTREITNFSYVSAGAAAPDATEPPRAKPPAEAGGPPVPPARVRPGQVRRTVALVVDDLGTSFESVAYVRNALRKFVNEQMQPDDLVAIMRTSAGMGALQQFTSDKQLLHRAIDRVRWYPRGRAGVSAFAPIAADPLARAGGQTGSDESEAGGGERRQTGLDAVDEFREEIFSVGTLGALNFIIRGLRELPGRKSVILFSDGFEIFNREGNSYRVVEALRRLTDLANRSSVVVYTIDARGLAIVGLTAADDVSSLSPAQVEQRLASRRDRLFNTQDGLAYLARQTGGFFVRNNNDLSGGVRRALDDQRGYYLIGYRPDPETFEAERGRGRFHRIEIKVRRPGLRVRTRSGFYGFTETERPVRRTRDEQLMAALSSPIGSGDLALRLTSHYTNEGERKDFISSLIHIDASSIQFAEEPDGWHKAVLDVVAYTIGENGQVIDSVNRTETLRARGKTYEEAIRSGFVYTIVVPVRKPGAYQLRTAVRDAGSERVGSASQLVEVPDLGKGRLALSGLVMAGNNVIAEGIGAAPTPTPAPAGEASAPDFDPMATPAVRRFRQGAQVEYLLHVYNAKPGPSGRPQLQTQMRLFRDGRQVFAGRLQDYDASGQTDVKRLVVAGRLRLGTALAPGDYVLQIVVYDRLAPEKHRMAAQWTDFEIVK
jgi:VWFA-related protein